MKREEALDFIKNKGFEPLEELPLELGVKTDKFKLIDKDGYKYFLTISNLKDKRSNHAIVKSFNPFSIENIQTFINNNGSKTKVMSKEWESGKDKITLECERCGRIYNVRWYHLFSDHKFQCNKCGYANPYNKKSIDDTERLCRKHKYSIIDGTYKSRHYFDMVDKQGYKYSDCNVYTLDKRTNKFKRFASHNTYQLENMKLYVKTNDLPILFAENKSTDIKKDDFINIYCVECGEIFGATWGQLTYKRDNSAIRNRCEVCSKSQSNLEYIIEQYLIELNVLYEKEKKFDWCKNKRHLPFDFYLNEYNTVLEINGTQHYYENKVMYWNTLEWQQERDYFKKNKCIENGINYIAIPYWNIYNTNKYQEIINNIISQNSDLIKQN